MINLWLNFIHIKTALNHCIIIVWACAVADWIAWNKIDNHCVTFTFTVNCAIPIPNVLLGSSLTFQYSNPFSSDYVYGIYLTSEYYTKPLTVVHFSRWPCDEIPKRSREIYCQTSWECFMRVLLCFQLTRNVRFNWNNMYNLKLNYLSRGQLVSIKSQ